MTDPAAENAPATKQTPADCDPRERKTGHGPRVVPGS
jgi:hypothetical protein